MSNSTESPIHRRIETSDDQRSNTWLNGTIGSLVGVLFAFVPYSPLLGGAVAGYLQRGDYTSGATVGTVAGVVALVPLILVGLLYVPAVSSVPVMNGVTVLPLVGLVIVYVIGLNVLGGVIGSSVRAEINR